MQIGILGSFEVRADGGALADVPGARLRALLIALALALEPGRVVSKATLIDWIWGEQPPADTANALQRLVSRLRLGALEDRFDAEVALGHGAELVAELVRAAGARKG